jgi:LysM repeat protein
MAPPAGERSHKSWVESCVGVHGVVALLQPVRTIKPKSMRSLFISFVSAIILAACAGPPKQPTAGQDTTRPGEQSESKSTGPEPGKVPDSSSKTGATEPKPACPADKAQAQDIAQHTAVNLLDEGREAEAKVELLKALCMDRNNALAASLMNQITADPVAAFAEKYNGKSFKYSVKAGDTLSKIAAAYLGDPYQFYILARYNGIAVPKSVHAGQVIKVPGVPGTASPAVAAPPPPPPPPPGGPAQSERLYQAGQQALIVGEKDKGYDLFMQASKLDPKDQRPRAEAEKLKPELIAAHDRKAREAFRRQDLNASIKEWDRVLELDPTNETARLERQRVEELKKHLQGVN